MSSWHSYPSIFNLGHSAIKDILSVDVNVEEKVDGSQFSFGLVEASEVDVVHCEHEGKPMALKIRSKGAVMHLDAPERMFHYAAETVKELAPLLHPGWTYRGEYLAKAKHNSLVYDRTPARHIIVFDVSTGDQEFLSYAEKKAEAERLGLEVVPLLYTGRIDSIERFRAFLSTTSVLGGQLIEGVVVKPKDYNLFGTDKKVLMGKFVSEAFKEVHRKAWAESNPTGKDILGLLGQTYASQARWNKAIQHLREAGNIEDSPRDIGPVLKEIQADIKRECEEEIKEYLFKWAWPHVSRLVIRGFPEYYKELLLKKQFENDPTASGGTPDSLQREVGSDIGDIVHNVSVHIVPDSNETK